MFHSIVGQFSITFEDVETNRSITDNYICIWYYLVIGEKRIAKMMSQVCINIQFLPFECIRCINQIRRDCQECWSK